MARGPSLSLIFNALDRVSNPVKGMRSSVTGFSKAAQSSLGGVSRGFQTLRRVAGLAAAAVTTGAIARAVNDFAKAGDEIAKTSRQLGLGVEALQELRFAADRQGVSTETLNTGFERMNVNLAAFQRREGQLYQILRATNPQIARQLSETNDTEEAFLLVNQAISETASAHQRAAIAQAAFGRSGQDIIKLAEVGVDGIAALREEAQRYGNIISTEAATSSEAFTDSMTNLRATMQSLRNNAMVPLINTIQPLIDKVTEWILANRELIGQRVQDVFNGIRRAVEVLRKAWDSGFLPAILAGVVAFKAVTTAIAAYQSILAIAKAVQMAFNVTLAANPIGAIIVGIALLTAGIVWMIRNWEAVVAWLKTAWEWIKNVGRQIVDLYDRFKGFAMLLAGPFIAPLIAVIAVIRNLIERFSEIREAFSEGGFIAGMVAIGRAILDGLVEPFRAAFDAIKQVGDLVQRINPFSADRREARQERRAERRGIVSPNEGVITSQSISESRSTVDVNLNNLPGGTSVRQTGRVPNVAVRTGYQEANMGGGMPVRTR